MHDPPTFAVTDTSFLSERVSARRCIVWQIARNQSASRNRDLRHYTPLRGCLATGSTNKNNAAVRTPGGAPQSSRCLSQMSPLYVIEDRVSRVFPSSPWVLEIIDAESEERYERKRR
ncbi:uncharacterized protein LOC143151454 [Ptiloglossa arizonensis]|uniref:uncharacterized protein LOC143151454 n=1 Tax=Ptiloglossa arizonensis TaxID=3350558 RepID=UPI003FA0F3D8